MMQKGIGVGDRPDHPANCNGLIEPYFWMDVKVFHLQIWRVFK